MRNRSLRIALVLLVLAFSYVAGAQVIVDGVEVHVTGYEFRQVVGSGILTKYPNGVFLLVEADLANNGLSAQQFNTWSFSLVDTHGRRYSVATDAALTLNTTGERNVVWMNTIQPGLSQRLVIPFDVPADVDVTQLSLVVEVGWGFSTRTGVVPLTGEPQIQQQSGQGNVVYQVETCHFEDGWLVVSGYFYNNGNRPVTGIAMREMQVFRIVQNQDHHLATASFPNATDLASRYLDVNQSLRWQFWISDVTPAAMPMCRVRYKVTWENL